MTALALALALALTAVADAAVTVADVVDRPYGIARYALASTTLWNEYDLPEWGRSYAVKNCAASGTLYVGNPGETGTYDSTDHATALAPGESLSLPLSEGRSTAPPSHLRVPLASSSASLTVCFVVSAAGGT